MRVVVAAEVSAVRQNMSDARREFDVSQAGLAEIMRNAGLEHWRQTTVSRVENGSQELSLAEVLALGYIFGPRIFEHTQLAWRDAPVFIPDDPSQLDMRTLLSMIAIELRELSHYQDLLQSADQRIQDMEALRSEAAAGLDAHQNALDDLFAQLPPADEAVVAEKAAEFLAGFGIKFPLESVKAGAVEDDGEHQETP